MGRTGRRWLLVIAGVVLLIAVAIGSGSSTGQSANRTTTTRTAESSSPSSARSTSAPGTTDATIPPPSSASPSATVTPTGPTPSSPSLAPPVRAAVDRLVVATPPADLPIYRRMAFGDGWNYDAATGCNTRELVLIDESATPPVLRTRCHPVAGSWRSAYDGVATANPDDLEIDHLIPLADAWRSGAAAWTPEKRRTFANDRSDPATLIAVTSHTNRSKSDRTPDQWMPPDPSDRCTYVRDWVEVKVRWELTVTPAEKATLVQILSGC
jgi:hypothetical protein